MVALGGFSFTKRLHPATQAETSIRDDSSEGSQQAMPCLWLSIQVLRARVIIVVLLDTRVVG